MQTAALNAYAIDSWGTDFVKLDYGVSKLTSLITTNISNEVLFQYGRELNDEGQQPLSSYTKANLQGTGTSAGNYPEINLASQDVGFILGSPYYSYRKVLPTSVCGRSKTRCITTVATIPSSLARTCCTTQT